MPELPEVETMRRGVMEIVDYTILFKSPVDGSKTTKTFRLDPTSYPKQIAIMEYPKHAGDFESDAAWTHESVGKALGGFFEGREPVKDSFIVPPLF